MRNRALLLYFWSVYCCFPAGSLTTLRPQGSLRDEYHKPTGVRASAKPSVVFNIRTSKDPEHEGCNLALGNSQLLEDCGFNMTAKTFFIIHGWTMSGMLEKWLYKLVSALQTREREANIVVVDWLPLAHQLYSDAVNNTRVVGQRVAGMLDWLQEKEEFSLANVHLIGYSLGAHVAGYAGNFVKGTLGRITGLDPAGPLFEKVDDDGRLSPDDADFVDVLHTFTISLGMSIGILRPVGHIDIYPNGGDSQPGCGSSDVLASLALGMITEVAKCEHERSVYLFVDSLLNQDKPSFAFQCTDPNRFQKGICLSCRKNRCNSIGYNAKKMRKKRNSKMYLKTRAGMPFRVNHYQMKIHIFNYKSSRGLQPVFNVTLYGTNADSQSMSLKVPRLIPEALGTWELYECHPWIFCSDRLWKGCMEVWRDLFSSHQTQSILPSDVVIVKKYQARVEKIWLNATNTFLVYTEEDLGDLLKIKLTWQGIDHSWYNLFNEIYTFLSQPRNPSRELHVRRIRVKSGETQRKMTFCAQDPKQTSISPGQELWFHKCRDGWRMKNETSPFVELA